MSKERNKAVPATYPILKKDGKVLLARRKNTGYYDGWYAVPGGHVEAGELPIGATIRELKEEIGITVMPSDVRFVHASYREAKDATGDRANYAFVVEKWSGEITNLEPEKCDDIQWFDVKNLPENTVHVVKDIIMKVEAGEIYSEIDAKHTHLNPTK